MTNPYTILINQSLKKVLVLDNTKTRYNRMRKRIASWVEVLNPVEDIKFVMVTLTYAPMYEWEPNHIRTFMLEIKKLLGESLLAYAWVAELQKRGAVHYHVMLTVPTDLEIGYDLPYPDELGLWSYGLTRVEIARTPYYLITYLGKEYQKDFSKFPKGIRVFAVYVHDPELKLSLRYKSLPFIQQAFVDEFGWSELKFMLKLRKDIFKEENIAWRIWAFEPNLKFAINQAEGWEELGYSWKGRDMFIGLYSNTEQ